MRTGANDTRLKSALMVTGASAIILFAVGAYLHLAGGRSDILVVSNPSLDAGKSGRSFIFHDTPQAVPELSFVDGAGRDLSLADFRGKTILLNVWATWCVPCRREMPALDRLQAKMSDANLEVLTLSVDRDGKTKVQDFYKEFGLEHLKIYVEAKPGTVSRDLKVVGLPTSLLIDRQGRELGRLIGPTEWDSPEVVGMIRQAIDTTRTADRK